MEGLHLATLALRQGVTLRVSNRTEVEGTEDPTVHAGTARKLVAYGAAEYPPDEQREGWKDMSRIRAVSRG